MSTQALYFTTPGAAQAQVSAANTAVDGTGTLVQLVAGTANGRRLAKVRLTTAIAGAQAANKINFFESIDGGTTKRFLCDALMPGTPTPSASVRAQYWEVPELMGKVLANANNIIYASTHVAQATNVGVEYNDA